MKEFHYFFLDGLDRKKIFLDTILVDFDLKKRKKGMWIDKSWLCVR